mgnify:CR=1 FL=1
MPLPIELAFLIVSYVILGGDVVWQAVRNISKGRVLMNSFFDECFYDWGFVIGGISRSSCCYAILSGR